jgi:fluoride exporter
VKTYFCIAAGGFLGAISRFIIKSVYIFDYKGNFPLNTLIVNVTGSLVLAFVLSLVLNDFKLNEDIKLGISTGFMGAYTTFSTLCKEMTRLMTEGNFFTALIYIIVSISLGLIAVYIGIKLSKMIQKWLLGANKNQ